MNNEDLIRSECKEKVSALVERLRNRKIDLAVFFDPANIIYFSGMRLIRWSDYVLCIDRDGEANLVVSRLDFERAKRDSWFENIVCFRDDTPEYLSVLGETLRVRPGRIGVEPRALTHFQANYLRRLSASDTELSSIEDELFALRSIKSKSELRLIRRAAAIADKAMEEAIKKALTEKDITEREVSNYAVHTMRLEGAEAESFEPFLMSGENGWLPQRFSSDRKLRPGELNLFDMGAVYHGYCSDITRTFSLGGLSGVKRRLFETACKAQQKAIEAIRPGRTGGEIDAVARDLIEKEGLGQYFPHLTGHGIGVSLHEGPLLDRGVATVLKPNMVVTVEPGIYVPEIGAARLEDMVLVTETGCEVLTNMKKDLI
jgi:Xaa-Pro aminopeptidase